MDGLPDKDIGCHRTGFARGCRDLVTSGRCNRWMQIHGKNPQTGEAVGPWDCRDNWVPTLLLDVAQKTNQLAAAVESARNEQAMNFGAVAAGLLAIAEGGPDSPITGRPLGPDAARLEGARRLAKKMNGGGET